MNPAPVGYQCPECVAQARATAPRRRYRIRFFVGRPGWVTTTLLVVNVAVFLVEVVVGGPGALGGGPSSRKLFDLGALYPPAIALGHQYWRLFTVMFLHAGILHIAFNMYALYLFGYLVESALRVAEVPGHLPGVGVPGRSGVLRVRAHPGSRGRALPGPSSACWEPGWPTTTGAARWPRPAPS